jgi:hypothetical protein
METLPTRSEGHLVVAAVRVLRHRDDRPPTDEEIADLLDLPREEVAHWARGLERHGVLRLVASAFDARWDVEDHTRLETLPAAADEAAMRKELASFEAKSRERHADLSELFGDAEGARSARTSRLEDELRKFKQSGRGRSPFDTPSASDEPDEDD